MLSEHPNVRVHNDPLRMCPAREPFRARNARGDLSLVRFFVSHKEMNEKFFKIFWIPAFETVSQLVL